MTFFIPHLFFLVHLTVKNVVSLLHPPPIQILKQAVLVLTRKVFSLTTGMNVRWV